MAKKASLSLSANAIVILVLAMVLLGLGVGFIRGIFDEFQPNINTVNEIIKEQLVRQLSEGDKKVALTNSQIDIKKNSESSFAIGVKNRNVENLKFKVELWIQLDSSTQLSSDGDESGERQLTLIWSEEEKELSAEEEGYYNVLIESGTFEKNNILIAKIRDTSDSSVYAEQDFFIKVKG